MPTESSDRRNQRNVRQRHPYRVFIDRVEWITVVPNPKAAAALAEAMSNVLPGQVVSLLATDGACLWALEDGRPLPLADHDGSARYIANPPRTGRADGDIWLGDCSRDGCRIGLRVGAPSASWFRRLRCPKHDASTEWAVLEGEYKADTKCFHQCWTAREKKCVCSCNRLNHGVLGRWTILPNPTKE